MTFIIRGCRQCGRSYILGNGGCINCVVVFVASPICSYVDARCPSGHNNRYFEPPTVLRILSVEHDLKTRIFASPPQDVVHARTLAEFRYDLDYRLNSGAAGDVFGNSGSVDRAVQAAPPPFAGIHIPDTRCPICSAGLDWKGPEARIGICLGAPEYSFAFIAC